MNSMSGQKFKGIPYSGTLPAVLTGTKAGYLQRYKIYGNTEQTGTPTPSDPIVPQECGERTTNLFNMDESSQGDGYTSNTIINSSGELISASWAWTSEYISITPNTKYCWFSDLFRVSMPTYRSIVLYTTQKEVIDAVTRRSASSVVEYKQDKCTFFTTPANAQYMRVSIDRLSTMNLLAEGSLAPSPYESYGYKLPLTSAGQNVNIFIGDDTLSTNEYIDSGTGKIYRRVSGVLTPVDPPVPFPQIPTTANSTTISWAGSGLAPSQFDSIQEWVDIPTYTYTNGEWVADT